MTEPTPAPAVFRALADELDTDRPDAPAHYWTIRGRARTHGLDDDGVEQLPLPDYEGMPRYAYARQLRTAAEGMR